MKIEFDIVSEQYVERMVDSYCKFHDNPMSEESEIVWDGFPRKILMAWSFRSKVWLVVDNEGGDCFCEEFRDYRKAIEWMRGDGEF